MNADQVSAAIHTIINAIIGWAVLASKLVFAVVILATLVGLLGHPIPYVPALRGSLQEVGIFTIGLAYWLK